MSLGGRWGKGPHLGPGGLESRVVESGLGALGVASSCPWCPGISASAPAPGARGASPPEGIRIELLGARSPAGVLSVYPDARRLVEYGCRMWMLPQFGAGKVISQGPGRVQPPSSERKM